MCSFSMWTQHEAPADLWSVWTVSQCFYHSVANPAYDLLVYSLLNQ